MLEQKDDPIEQALQASEGNFRTVRMQDCAITNAEIGTIYWSPIKSIWISATTLIALTLAPFTFTPSAFLLFIFSTAITICLGHSLGMHRRLIHRSFECSLFFEHILVYLGTVVGMAGPYGMIRQHDIRDWAQRKPKCHPYLAHKAPLWVDFWRQLHCELKLDNPPELNIEQRVTGDRFYQFLQKTWIAQQIPWAILFYLLGGWPWLIWGIAVRVALCTTGHWLVGYFAHNQGLRNWHVEGAGVQGYNIQYCSILTMGESWHNNHHAFPGSARLGLKSNEIDLGWTVLLILSKIGLVWGIKCPEDLPERECLVSLKG